MLGMDMFTRLEHIHKATKIDLPVHCNASFVHSQSIFLLRFRLLTHSLNVWLNRWSSVKQLESTWDVTLVDF